MRPKNRACSMPMASECVETFPAELKQLFASWLRHAGLRPGTAIAQLFATDQAVVAIAIGGDAVEGEPGPPCACAWRCTAAGEGRRQRGCWPWSDAGGCRATGPGLVLDGPSGHCPYWDPFWRGRIGAAVNPAQGVGVPPQSPSSSGPMGILNACLRPSAQKAFHLFDQCLGSLAPGRAIQAEFFGFVVVAVLHRE